MIGIMRTSEDWSKLLSEGVRVLDPDGWDRKNFDYSWYEELITQHEFESRFIRSTVASGSVRKMWSVANPADPHWEVPKPANTSNEVDEILDRIYGGDSELDRYLTKPEAKAQIDQLIQKHVAEANKNMIDYLESHATATDGDILFIRASKTDLKNINSWLKELES